MAVSVAPTPAVPLLYVTAANAAVVLATQEPFMSSPSATESTYALLAASVVALGLATPLIILPETATVPVPVGTSVTELSAPVAPSVGADPLNTSEIMFPPFTLAVAVTTPPCYSTTECCTNTRSYTSTVYS